MLREALRRLILDARSVSLESAERATELGRHESVRRCRQLARRYEFHHLGWIRSTLGSTEVLTEVWSDRTGTLHLTINDLFYMLRSRLADRRLVCTFSHQQPLSLPHRWLVARGGTGSFAEDVEAHRRVVEGAGAAPVALATLEAHAADERRYLEEDLPILWSPGRRLCASWVLVAALQMALLIGAFLAGGVDARTLYLAMMPGVAGYLLYQAFPHTALRRARQRATSLGLRTLGELAAHEFALAVAEADLQVELRGRAPGQRCPYCLDTVASHEAQVCCASCVARHHDECWAAHGACASCGSTARFAGVLDDGPRATHPPRPPTAPKRPAA